MSSGCLQEVKNNVNILIPSPQQVVVVMSCRALTGKILVFWIGGHL